MRSRECRSKSDCSLVKMNTKLLPQGNQALISFDGSVKKKIKLANKNKKRVSRKKVLSKKKKAKKQDV